MQITILTGCICCFQAHPWFKGIKWDKLYQIKAAFILEVNDELDTQNFEKFEEVDWCYCVYKYEMICLDIFLLFSFLSCTRLTTKFHLQQNQVHGERLVEIYFQLKCFELQELD